MLTFFEKLEARCQQIDSLLCIGLDPTPSDLSGEEGVLSTSSALVNYCRRIVEETIPYAAAYKPNSAFFEAWGAGGLRALQQVIASIPKEIPVILDAKRGDIASTAQAYARAAFDVLDAGAVTVNPYLGADAVQPFLEYPERGVFLLCKTSNPGANDLQNLSLAGGEKLYERVVRLAIAWNRRGNLGLVVGATYPEELRRVRQMAAEMWILAPGVGVQGADLEAVVQAGLRQDSLGLLVTISRAISQATEPSAAAEALRAEINRYREQYNKGVSHQRGNLSEELCALADQFLATGCIQFGRYTLKSGLESPIYIDLRRLISMPDLLGRVAGTYIPILKRLKFDRLAALPYAAIPIATAISLQGGWPMIYPRKETKEYGTKVEIEGVYNLGERVVVIDDLATTGGSKFEAIEKLTTAGLQVSDVVVLIDRQSGAKQALARAGYHLHAVITLGQMLDYWELQGSVKEEQLKRVREFLRSTSA
jgi:uridine monophosphate synthetase